MDSISIKNMVLPRPRYFNRDDAIFFAAAFLFIYGQLFEFPFTPIYFEGDHLISVSNAMRMLDGEVIYRDFFHLTPPGAEIVYTTLFSIFGVKLWILNLIILFLGLAQVWLLWFFSRHTLSGIFVYLPASIFFIVGFRPYGIDGSYRLFSIVCVLLAVAILFKKRSTQNLIIAGGLCGLASFFVQTRGIVAIAGILLFLLWENYRCSFDLTGFLKNGLQLAIPFLLVVVLTHSYFVWMAGFDNYYFSLVEFLHKHYPNDPLAKTSVYIFSDLPDFQSFLNESSTKILGIFRYVRLVFPAIFHYLLIPFIYIGYFVYRRRRQISQPEKEIDTRLMFLSLIGLTLVAGLSAPSAGRLNHIAIPGLIILVWLFKQIPYSNQIAKVALLFLCLIGISYVVQRQVIEKQYLDMPAGRSAFLSPNAFDRYNWIGENTLAGDSLFEAQHPSFYFPFHLKNPTTMSLIRDSEYTPRFQVDSVVASLEREPPNLIVWDGKWTKPAESRVAGDNLEPLWQFIVNNYDLAMEYPVLGDHTLSSERDIEIWRRKSPVN